LACDSDTQGAPVVWIHSCSFPCHIA
jgi:hypothetical protein